MSMDRTDRTSAPPSGLQEPSRSPRPTTKSGRSRDQEGTGLRNDRLVPADVLLRGGYGVLQRAAIDAGGPLGDHSAGGAPRGRRMDDDRASRPLPHRQS